MEFIVIIIVSIVVVVGLRIMFHYNKKKLETIGKNEELDNLTKKYPSNIEMCKEYLKKLNNEKVIVEENTESEASLYIAITDKISIANIQNSYTRIQTIAHECLHSVQDRKLLVFNFIFSNIYFLYFIVLCVLGLMNSLPCPMMFLAIFVIASLVYYMVRSFLENDAMIKAKYLAKEYMEEKEISTPEEIEKIVNEFDKINQVGIPATNYYLFSGIMLRIIVVALICLL